MQKDSWRKYSSSEGIPSITQNSWRRIHPSVRFKCQHNKGTPLPAPPALQICHAGKEKLDRGTAAIHDQHCLSTLPLPSPLRKNVGDCLTFLERAEQTDVAEDSILFEDSYGIPQRKAVDTRRALSGIIFLYYKITYKISFA